MNRSPALARALRRRAALAAALAVGILAAVAASAAETASSHTGTSLPKCAAHSGQGDQTFTGTLYASPWSLNPIYAVVYVYGWSGWNGTATVNNITHSTIWIPANTSHRFPGPAIQASGTGAFGYRVSVDTGPGVDVVYGVDIHASGYCGSSGGGGGCLKIEVNPFDHSAPSKRPGGSRVCA